jgi:hypothetical protein
MQWDPNACPLYLCPVMADWCSGIQMPVHCTCALWWQTPVHCTCALWWQTPVHCTCALWWQTPVHCTCVLWWQTLNDCWRNCMLEESKPSWVNQSEVKHVCGQAPCETYLDCGVSECQGVFVCLSQMLQFAPCANGQWVKVSSEWLYRSSVAGCLGMSSHSRLPLVTVGSL